MVSIHFQPHEMTGMALLLLSLHASYMTGGEYFVDGYVSFCCLHAGTVPHNPLQWTIDLLTGQSGL